MAAPQDVKIEQYKTLREEVLHAVDGTITTTHYVLLALGALSAFGAKAYAEPGESGAPAAIVIFLVLIPIVSLFGIVWWLAEVHRLRRASFYLSDVERSLGLQWENWLRKPVGTKRQLIYIYNHRITYILFVFAGLSSFLAGLWLFLSAKIKWPALNNPTDKWWWGAIAFVVVVTVIFKSCNGWEWIGELESNEDPNAMFGQTPSVRLRSTTSRARQFAGQGRRSEAHDMLQTEICHWSTETAYTADLDKAKRLLQELLLDVA
jgi:hypothetical protein